VTKKNGVKHWNLSSNGVRRRHHSGRARWCTDIGTRPIDRTLKQCHRIRDWATAGNTNWRGRGSVRLTSRLRQLVSYRKENKIFKINTDDLNYLVQAGQPYRALPLQQGFPDNSCQKYLLKSANEHFFHGLSWVKTKMLVKIETRQVAICRACPCGAPFKEGSRPCLQI
jgi:hypothetical protein